MLLAALHDHVACVHGLVVRGADLDRRARTDGRTALHWACRHGHDRVARLLLDGGAETALTDLRGASAHDLAEMQGHAACVSLLDAREAGQPRTKVDDRYLRRAGICLRRIAAAPRLPRG